VFRQSSKRLLVLGLLALIVALVVPPASSHDPRLMQLLGGGDGPGLDDADLCLYRGHALVERGQFARAIDEYTRSINLKPFNVWAYISRGITYMDMGKYDRALVDLNSAQGLDEDNYEVYVNRGLIYAAMGHYDSAVIDCNIALEKDSTQAEAYSNRGNYHANLGDLKAGLADCQQAISMDSTYGPAWLGCTLIYVEMGKKEKSVESFKKLLELNPPELAPVIEQLRMYIDTSGTN